VQVQLVESEPHQHQHRIGAAAAAPVLFVADHYAESGMPVYPVDAVQVQGTDEAAVRQGLDRKVFSVEDSDRPNLSINSRSAIDETGYESMPLPRNWVTSSSLIHLITASRSDIS
jgi:hypothetical protein